MSRPNRVTRVQSEIRNIAKIANVAINKRQIIVTFNYDLIALNKLNASNRAYSNMQGKILIVCMVIRTNIRMHQHHALINSNASFQREIINNISKVNASTRRHYVSQIPKRYKCIL